MPIAPLIRLICHVLLLSPLAAETSRQQYVVAFKADVADDVQDDIIASVRTHGGIVKSVHASNALNGFVADLTDEHAALLRDHSTINSVEIDKKDAEEESLTKKKKMKKKKKKKLRKLPSDEL